MQDSDTVVITTLPTMNHQGVVEGKALHMTITSLIEDIMTAVRMEEVMILREGIERANLCGVLEATTRDVMPITNRTPTIEGITDLTEEAGGLRMPCQSSQTGIEKSSRCHPAGSATSFSRLTAFTLCDNYLAAEINAMQ